MRTSPPVRRATAAAGCCSDRCSSCSASRSSSSSTAPPSARSASRCAATRTSCRLVLGVVLIVLGLVFAGVLSLFQRDLRVHKVPAVGLGAAPLIGALFAIGWTPCVGPTFGVILNLTFADGATAARGGLLALCYALGLGLPFIVVALLYNRLSHALGWVRRHQSRLHAGRWCLPRGHRRADGHRLVGPRRAVGPACAPSTSARRSCERRASSGRA
ncbi:cytochrome c biogenesis protein CcdA [Nocardioides convexus]|uniref:cytochrome c biogenesis CcdA family protein n=1 Tax=Nocardioides convexus TaxID=2712224 RepID=UPI00241826E0|nr:cytochrome c biogenesis protein CcdA [Nocardioides convexus]